MVDTGLIESLVQSERLFEGYPLIFRAVDQQRRNVAWGDVVDGRSVVKYGPRMFVMDAGEEERRLVGNVPAGHECSKVRRCVEADDRLDLAGSLTWIGRGR